MTSFRFGAIGYRLRGVLHSHALAFHGSGAREFRPRTFTRFQAAFDDFETVTSHGAGELIEIGHEEFEVVESVLGMVQEIVAGQNREGAGDAAARLA